MKTKLALIVLVFLSFQTTIAQEKQALPEVDCIRLGEAFRISESLGNQIWSGWDQAPFTVLLVTPDYEYLIRHPHPSDDFTLVGYDSLLQSNVYFRKRTYAPNLLATFPAVGSIPTIVIGQAENTSKQTSTPWVVTVLHEHFHQLQYSQPGYYQAVNALDLSHGDQTGMWMLNYDFPYSSPQVDQEFAAMSRRLVKALQAQKKAEFTADLKSYLKARQKFARMLSPDDYKYFSFQVWQEGIARYTEYRVADLAARHFQPSKAFRTLKDYQPFQEIAVEIKSTIIQELSTLRLDAYKRTVFYPLGAADGLLLDRSNPQWKSRYFTEKFYVEKYFDMKR